MYRPTGITDLKWTGSDTLMLIMLDNKTSLKRILQLVFLSSHRLSATYRKTNSRHQKIASLSRIFQKSLSHTFFTKCTRFLCHVSCLTLTPALCPTLLIVSNKNKLGEHVPAVLQVLVISLLLSLLKFRFIVSY